MRLASIVALLAAAAPSIAQAPPPNQLHFQARLSNAAGAPLTGPVSLTIRVYDVPVGGSPLWSETQLATPIDGVATLALGSVNALPATLFDGATRYVALQVFPDAEMTPRRAIVPVPFAAHAAKASALDANATIPPSVVTTTQVLDGTIATADLANSAVTAAKVAANAITSGKLASNSVTASAIAAGAVGTSEIADGAVTLAQIASPLSANVAGAALDVTNAAATGTAVRGFASGTTNVNVGVHGESAYGAGIGVRGWSLGTGVYGQLLGLGNGYGVRGRVDTVNSVGVFGEARTTSPSTWSGTGVAGYAWGTNTTMGVVGYATATTGSGTGVYGQTGSPNGTAVKAIGDLVVSGAKSFAQPHPTDPSREIRFACLEGNESGTYFRGSSRLVHGVAEIVVPEEFRLVTEKAGLGAVATPVGAPTALWIESKDLDRVVVRGDRDVDFDYVVNGVRRGFADHRVVRANQSFVPELRGVLFGTQYPEAFRRILVENGILNADFTPNEETAARLGWTLRDADPDRDLGGAR